jgi:hypothetical protein
LERTLKTENGESKYLSLFFTTVIEDKAKMDNNYWNGGIYEISSGGQKYYLSEKMVYL